MSIKSIVIVLLFALISGCKATAVRNVEEAQFVVPSYASLEDIKKAIIRGSIKAGWRVKELAPGELAASYSYKRNRFGAVVKIHYDRNAYDIIYHSSHNLKYTEYHENIDPDNQTSGFLSDSKDFFSENLPFVKDSEEQQSATQPATIHKIYNKWVTELERKIDYELAALSTKPRSQVKVAAAPIARAINKVDCDDEPEYSVSGQGRISRASVNVRKGASTRCEILTSLRGRDRFTLLGKKDGWYYIVLDNGTKGWIYASLVSRVTEKTLPRSQNSVPVTTSLPEQPEKETIYPTKNISIAVIRFKTLNKEAQDISLGELVSETFTSALVNSRNFKIIEREQLDKLVKEMEMGQTGFIETTDAVEIGKMLHADAIITGSVALLGGQIQLNARIIEIESAYVISADTKTTAYTLKNINLMANEIVAKLAERLGNH